MIIDRARAMSARQQGLKIEARVMDGHALELDDKPFDMAGSQFGVMLLPTCPRASQRWRGSLSRGRLLMNVYGDPHTIEFFRFLVGVID